ADRGVRKGGNGALDLSGVAHVDRDHLHPQRRRYGLNNTEQAGPPGLAGSRSTAARVISGAMSLSSSSHFPPMLYSKLVKPVAFPPGRARLSTIPAPTGSTATGNTIGTVRVTCSNAATEEAP